MPALQRRSFRDSLDTATEFKSLWIQSPSSSVATDKTGKEMNGKCPPLYGEGFWIQSPSSSVVTDKTGREICGKRPPYRGELMVGILDVFSATQVFEWITWMTFKIHLLRYFWIYMCKLATSKEEEGLGPEMSLLRRQYKWYMTSSFTFIFKMADRQEIGVRLGYYVDLGGPSIPRMMNLEGKDKTYHSRALPVGFQSTHTRIK
ncbi:hypothetical protein ACROYT_G038519 [Oculina patagonica]